MHHVDVISFQAIFWVSWALIGMAIFIIASDFFNKITNGYKAILWIFLCGPIVWLGEISALIVILTFAIFDNIKAWFTS